MTNLFKAIDIVFFLIKNYPTHRFLINVLIFFIENLLTSSVIAYSYIIKISSILHYLTIIFDIKSI